MIINAKVILLLANTVFLGILSLFEYQFFQYALLGGIISAIATGLVGLFLILRREAMIGDGIAHTAFGGIALGLLLGINPLITALFISVVAVFSISYMRKKGLAKSDAAIAVMLAVGFSTGLIIISIAGGFNIEIFSYLFGSILTITQVDLIIVSVLGIVSIIFFSFFKKELLLITFDEDNAKITGIPVRFFSICFNLLVAFTIVLSIKVIGVILVVALMVLPALAALQLKRSFTGTMVATLLCSSISVVGGILLSALYNVATSGFIVFIATSIFVGAAVGNRVFLS
ncbi:MAG: metal ABC transporter permease [Candidatus Thermoplasmatota archaeon]